MSGPDLLNLVEAAKEGVSVTDKDALYEAAKAAIKTVYDPEIPVDVWELGLIYRLEAKDNGRVEVDMTLTAPNCPVADLIPRNVAQAIEQVDGVSEVAVELVWHPPWDKSRMSEAARLDLDMF